MRAYENIEPVTFTLPLNKKKTSILKEALEYYMDYQDIKLAKKRVDDKEIEAEKFFEEIGV